MFTKFITASMFSLGLLAVGAGGASNTSKDCCSAKLACCKTQGACCEAKSRLGCCEKGQKCCADNIPA